MVGKEPLGVEAVAELGPQGPLPIRREAGFGSVFAALDLGTNNCRLLVARPLIEGGFRVIDAFSRIVRLGEGVSATGRLSEAAMARTIDALRVCAVKIQRRGATHIRCVATEACRRAANCAEFVARVRRETGILLEIITAREEAALAFNGCAPLLEAGWPRAVVFDIGGGSTEVGWLGLEGAVPELIGWLSIPIGVVTLAERHGSARLPETVYDVMVEEVAHLLRPFAAAHGIAEGIAAGRVQMLGTSGTVTTLAGVHLGLPRYDRNLVDGRYLDFAAIRRVSAALAAMECAERAGNPCIGRDRADLVVAGCAILEAMCRLWPVGRLRVADRGVREGILHGLMYQASAAAAQADSLPA
jgi:exopolyphosphatase/guanosine-5'-triphosphate,3'-diphosphate pyrophosphatase